jgi:hypothetical protein
MATNKTVKPTTKNSPAIHTGANRDNGPASAYTGFKYPEGGGNDINIYKQPMVNPENSDIQYATNPNTMTASESTPGGMPARNVSIGNKTRGPKTEGITMRGHGAAIKGIKSRGPMA